MAGDLWGIDAKPLDLRVFARDGGDEVELTVHHGVRTLRIDGEFWEVEASEL